jgi:hypothetical protein
LNLLSWVQHAIPCLEARDGAARSFYRGFAAGEDLLDSLLDPHARVMREIANHACALGAWWFQSHLGSLLV